LSDLAKFSATKCKVIYASLVAQKEQQAGKQTICTELSTSLVN